MNEWNNVDKTNNIVATPFENLRVWNGGEFSQVALGDRCYRFN